MTRRDKVSVVIPFRDRGQDPNRPANLKCVVSHWQQSPWTVRVQSDNKTGPFNRSAAYNLAMEHLGSDIYIFSEADIIIPFPQVEAAVRAASECVGLVVPFTSLMDLDQRSTDRARNGESVDTLPSVPRRSYPTVGAVNVVSKESMQNVGRWDERFQGAWSDDNAMERAFFVCCGPTRFVEGNAHHLFHFHPGMAFRHPGAGHMPDTVEDQAAMEANRVRWFRQYRKATTPERIRELTNGGD